MTVDGKLPDGWQVLKFSEIAESITERVDDPSASGLDYYVGLEHLDPDTLKVSRWGSPSDVEATKLRCYPGDVIYARRRAYQRKLGVAEWDCIASAHALILRARPDVCLPEFLPYFLQSDQFHQRALDISVGSLSPTINWKTLAIQEFVLPSMGEQDQQVAVLAAVDHAHGGYVEVLARARALGAAVAAQGVPVGAGSPISTRLGELCDVQVGFPFKSDMYAPAGIRLLRCSNVAVGSLSWETDATRFWPESECAYFAEFQLIEGDVVIAMDRPFIGDGFKIARVRKRDLPALLLQRVGRLVPRSGVTGDLLWALMNSPGVPAHLMRKQKGTDLPHISRFDIESIPVTLQPEDYTSVAENFAAVESVKLATEAAAAHLRQARTVLLAGGAQ